jgi:hypothetical protein
MYVGSGVDDRIHRVMPDGSTEEFYYFGAYALDGTPWGIAFAPPDTYGGLMYVATSFPGESSLSGVLAFRPDGTFTKFAPEILNAWDIEFDSTGLMFGGALYAYGNYGSGRRIWRIDADGSTGGCPCRSWRLVGYSFCS